MNELKEVSQQYLDGLISPKEYIARLVGLLAGHWDSIDEEANTDELANSISSVFLLTSDNHG